MITDDATQAAEAEAIIARLRPAGRTCGECYACCKLPLIEQLHKPTNELCRHANPNQTGGCCTIYQTRPNICRGFSCVLLLDGRFPDAWRPDRSGLMMSYSTDANGQRWLDITVRCLDHWREPPYRTVLEEVAQRELASRPPVRTRIFVGKW